MKQNKFADFLISAFWALFLCLVFLRPAYPWSVGGGVNLLHEQVPFVVFRGDDLHLLYSDKSGLAVGAAYNFIEARRGWELGLGAAWVEKVGENNRFNGTHWNFLVNTGYSFGDWSTRWSHISNGKKLGIGPGDKPNSGWNILTIERNF